MTTNKKITINDIAQLAGVSIKTVSRVINNEANVGQETRSRLQKIISDQNYTPDPQARGLASKKSFLISLIHNNPNTAFVSDAMYGALESCKPAGYELVIHPCETINESAISDIINFITRLKIDGVLILPPLSESTELINELKKTECNYVRVLSVADEDCAHMIHFNDRVAVKMIADHLSELGHTNIGFIQGPEGFQSAVERYEGFKAALKSQNLKLPTSRIAKGAYTFQSGLECAEWLLHSKNPPTAIFASNDQMAMGCLVAAKKMGLDVPNDLTVIGFDDSPQASEVWPALTTINLQVRKMGKLASDKLMLLCKEDSLAAMEIQTKIEPKFIQRQSTAEPKK